MNPPHSARFRSNGLRAEKCCAGVSVIGSAEVFASCHQSSSSTRRIPADRTSAPFPKRRHDERIEALARACGASADRSDRSGCDSAARSRSAASRRTRTAGCRTRRGPIRFSGPARSGIHRVGQDVSCRRLNQKRRVTDERDDGGGAVQRRRPSRRLVDTRRPRRSRLEQHPRNRREWLPGGAGRIDESSAIKVIALLQAMPPRASFGRSEWERLVLWQCLEKDGCPLLLSFEFMDLCRYLRLIALVELLEVLVSPQHRL